MNNISLQVPGAAIEQLLRNFWSNFTATRKDWQRMSRASATLPQVSAQRGWAWPNGARLALSLVVLLPLVGGVLWSASESGEKEPDPDALYRYLAIFSETLKIPLKAKDQRSLAAYIQLLAEQAALGIQLVRGQLGSIEHADPGDLLIAGERAFHADPHLVARRCRR